MTNKKTWDALGKIEIFFRISYQNNNSKIHLHVKVIFGKKDYKGLAVLFQSNPFGSLLHVLSPLQLHYFFYLAIL
jgi:hypothetical protein